jgi:hypothetical protein
VYRVSRAFRFAGTPRFFAGILALLGFALAAQAEDKAAWAWFWGSLGEQGTTTPADAAWAWAGLPPCQCGGKGKDCPCASAKAKGVGKSHTSGIDTCAFGDLCTCGCKSGKPCNCVAQEKAYADLTKRMFERGGLFAVFVGCDAPWDFPYPHCRWDAFPEEKPGTVVWARKIGDELTFAGRTFRQACPDGKCPLKK